MPLRRVYRSEGKGACRPAPISDFIPLKVASQASTEAVLAVASHPD